MKLLKSMKFQLNVAGRPMISCITCESWKPKEDTQLPHDKFWVSISFCRNKVYSGHNVLQLITDNTCSKSESLG